MSLEHWNHLNTCFSISTQTSLKEKPAYKTQP